MKIINVVVLIILSSFFQKTFSQTDTSVFAPIGAKWYYGFEIAPMESDKQVYVLIESVKDTIIKGINCKILQETEHFDTGLVNLGKYIVYGEGSKVYYFHPKGKFELLYNFSAIKGDTLTLVNLPNTYDSITKIEITRTDTLIVNNHKLRRLYDMELSDYGKSFGTYIERIGGLIYFFPEEYRSDASRIGPLRCYEDNELGLVKFGNIDCDYSDYLVGIDEKRLTTSNVRIFPNPFNDAIKIDSDKLIKSIRLINTSGSTIFHKNNILSNNVIVNEYIKPGMYLLKVDFKDFFITKIVFKTSN